MTVERIPTESEINFKYSLADFLADTEFYPKEIKSKQSNQTTKGRLLTGIFSPKQNEEDQSLQVKRYFIKNTAWNRNLVAGE